MKTFFFFFQPTVFILYDVGMQNEVVVVHNAAIQEQVTDCVGNIKPAHLWGFVCGVKRLNILNSCVMFKGTVDERSFGCD